MDEIIDMIFAILFFLAGFTAAVHLQQPQEKDDGQ